MCPNARYHSHHHSHRCGTYRCSGATKAGRIAMEVILRRVPVLLLIWLLASTIGISAQQQNTPQQTPEKPAWAWDWHKAFAPESLSNWVLMLVGIGGTLAALRTLKTINRQTTF